MTVSDELVRKGALALLHAAVGHGKLSDLEDREAKRLMDDARTVAIAILPAIQAEERERCAKVAEECRHPNWSAENEDWCAGTEAAAAAIRAMGEKP
jgi:DNA-binding IclR family transcriptional regulator